MIMLQNKIDAILIIGEARGNLHEACRIYNARHPDHPTSRSYLRKLLQKFQTTGSVQDKKKSGRPRIPENQEINVIADVVLNPRQTSSTVAQNCGVSTRSAQRVLKRYKFHPYKLRYVHYLKEIDKVHRMAFCEAISLKIDEYPDYTKAICFSDESTFFLNRRAHNNNVRYWSDERPNMFRENHTQYPEKVNVWAGILGNHIVGPVFLNENLTGDVYLEILISEVEPLILEILENNPEEFGDYEITFQQDGAPPHYHGAVREYMNEQYPNRWIGRRGAIEWPPRSPDLTPLDFFLWGYLKSKVYETQPNNIEILKEKIREECRLISADTFQRVRAEFYNRILLCQEVGGAQFEHL